MELYCSASAEEVQGKGEAKMKAETCVCCGTIIPEGTQYCKICEKKKGKTDMKKANKSCVERAVRAYNAFLHNGFDKMDADDTATYCKRSVNMDVLHWGTVWDVVVMCCCNKKGFAEVCKVLEILGYEVIDDAE